MTVDSQSLPNNQVKLQIVTHESELKSLKDHVVGHFVGRVKIAGFRNGKAPLNLVEKQVSAAELQSEFLEEAVNNFYQKAVLEAKIKPIERPEVTIKKFVPFTTLEFDVVVTIIGKITLADYKNLKVSMPKVNVSDKHIDEVVESLRRRLAEKKSVKRVAKAEDELTIDFKGNDAKGQPIAGADGTDYPLVLGSKSFIPGFEDNLIGLKSGDKKTFKLKFPKDYGSKALANQTIEFEVQVKNVQELELAKPDDEFAAKAGPFKDMKELRADVKVQLLRERQSEADRDFEASLIKQITEKSKVEVPKALVDEQVEQTLGELKQDLVYRGQTYQEFLDQSMITDEENRKRLIPGATERVKAGLVLSEISENENLTVSDDELSQRIQSLKEQYKDEQMQTELGKPEARRDIANRLLTQKTIDLIAELNR